MSTRMAGFHGEYLWELEIAERQLLELAAAMPEAKYAWQPAQNTRAFSAILVHIATCHLTYLHLLDVRLPEHRDLYGDLSGDSLTQLASIIRKNVSLEQSVTRKEQVIALLKRSFASVRQSFAGCRKEDLERTEEFFGEPTTVRRVYLRIMAHTHEHMGQAIAYARTNGINAPWPDPLRELDSIELCAP